MSCGCSGPCVSAESLACNAAPLNVTAGPASAGVSTVFSRCDHKHDIETGVPVAIGLVNSEGVSDTLARSDHIHDASAILLLIPVACNTAPLDVGAGPPSAGVSPEFSRCDHEHALAAGASGALTFANVAAMSAFDATTTSDGASAQVFSLDAQWTLDKTSALVADGIIVATATPAGRWLRVVGGSIRWARQTAWTIDPVAGNDENAGGALAPVKTAVELSRRWNGQAIASAIAVTVLAGNAGAFQAEFASISAVITFIGPVTQSASVVLTSVINQVAATDTRGRIGTAATPFVDGTRVALTSGVNSGAINYVTGIPAANEAFVASRFLQGAASPTLVDATVGDTIAVDTLTATIGPISVYSGSTSITSGAVVFQDLNVTSSVIKANVLLELNRCLFAAAVTFQGGGLLARVRTSRFAAVCTVRDGANVQPFAGCTFKSNLTMTRQAAAQLERDCCFDGGQLQMDQAVLVLAGGTTNGNTGWVDQTAEAIILNEGGFIAEGSAQEKWGANRSGALAVRVRPMATWDYITLPHIGGSTVDTNIGGNNKQWADLSFFDAGHGCGIVLRP